MKQIPDALLDAVDAAERALGSGYMATLWKRLEKRSRDRYVASDGTWEPFADAPMWGSEGPWRRRCYKWCVQDIMKGRSKRCSQDCVLWRKQGEN